MSLHADLLVEEFESKIETYKKLKDIVLSKLREAMDPLGISINVIEGRVKTVKSLRGKLDLKGDKYATLNDITDLFGGRIVTFYSNDIDLVSAKVTSIFDIDWENSIDKRKIYKVDQFGYLSVHYICKLPKSMYEDPTCPELNEIPFEIQIRSVLQHTWATIYHDTGYKNDIEVPSEYLRSLNRLAGLLEIADKSFSDIKTSLEGYRRRVKELVSSGKLEEIELNGDSFIAYLNSGSIYELNDRIATINNMDVEKVNLRNLLKPLKDLGLETVKDLDTLVKDCSDDAYKFCIYQFENTDIDIIASTTGLLTLMYVYLLRQNASIERIEELLVEIYGQRKSNASFANKIMKIGKTMGLIKE